MIIAALALAAALTAPAAETADPSVAGSAAVERSSRPVTVSDLKVAYISALTDAERGRALDGLAQAQPISAQDVSGLFDLFSRFATPEVRRAVMASLALIPPNSPQIEPLFVTYLKQPEPEAQLFGVNGAFRLRSRAALPLVRAIAERKFAAASAAETSVLSERNAWWTQYEALSAIAQWEGEKALPLVRAKSDESPIVGRLLGRFYWKQTLPQIAAWSRSEDIVAREKAREAVSAPIEPADARATRSAMMALFLDDSLNEEIRHQLALKIGAVSEEKEVVELIKLHDQAADPKIKLYLAAAVFASRRDAAVPLLVRYARESESEEFQHGATNQLIDMLGLEAAMTRLGAKKQK